jgi:Domain of unknown function (DUF4398)
VKNTSVRLKHFLLPAASALLLLSLAGCATPPRPEESLQLAQSAINEAQREGAAQLAPGTLVSAQDKLASANQEAARSDGYVPAVRLAEEAQADARLAGATARAVKAERSATELDQSLDALRAESQRTSPGDSQ